MRVEHFSMTPKSLKWILLLALNQVQLQYLRAVSYIDFSLLFYFKYTRSISDWINTSDIFRLKAKLLLNFWRMASKPKVFWFFCFGFSLAFAVVSTHWTEPSIRKSQNLRFFQICTQICRIFSISFIIKTQNCSWLHPNMSPRRWQFYRLHKIKHRIISKGINWWYTKYWYSKCWSIECRWTISNQSQTPWHQH